MSEHERNVDGVADEAAPKGEALEPLRVQLLHQALATAEARAAEIVEESTPPATRRARVGALRYFWAWAGVAHGLGEGYPVAPALLLDFLTSHLDGLPEAVDVALQEAGIKRPGRLSLATLEARLSHLAKAHRVQGYESPASDARVRELLAAARRQRAQGPGQQQKAALVLRDLNRLVAACELEFPLGGRTALAAYRDRAILLVGFAAGGRRRSELAELRVEDLRKDGGDYIWALRRSKTDQTGTGLVVPIAGRAAEALAAWLEMAGVSSGPVLRAIDRHGNVGERAITGRSVGQIVKTRAERVGLDPAAYGGHSLRAGFMTTAGRVGISLQEAMGLSGHRTPAVAMRYHRVGDVLRSKAARLVG